MRNANKPREYPETAEGKEAWERFRELTRRLVKVPKESVRERERQEGS